MTSANSPTDQHCPEPECRSDEEEVYPATKPNEIPYGNKYPLVYPTTTPSGQFTTDFHDHMKQKYQEKWVSFCISNNVTFVTKTNPLTHFPPAA